MNGHEGHHVQPHEHAWQIREAGFVYRCSGRYLCTTCWKWLDGERCDLAERNRDRRLDDDRRRAARSAIAIVATARPPAAHVDDPATAWQNWRVEPVGAAAR